MSDPRFGRLKTDPRFRRPRKKQQKVVIDERFKSLFDQPKGKRKETAELHVDKYGRKISTTHEDNLRKYYRLAPATKNASNDVDEVTGVATEHIDYARGGILMESSDEEAGEDGLEGEATGDDDSDEGDTDEIVKVCGNENKLEVDLDEDTCAELDAQVAAYAEANKDLGEREEQDVSPTSRTRRLAVANLDWDYVRASHLYKIFSSLVSPTASRVPVTATPVVDKGHGTGSGKGGSSLVSRGTILSVNVYPSEFGKARMEREEREGPPVEIFRKNRKESNEINEKTIYEIGDENEYDEDALRRYQLERLRYYYAIVECDSTEAASHIYNELEGTELERSANVFDLSFVPDGMTFDDEPRDTASEDMSTEYRPVDYVTDALRHSRVKITWDEDDPERHQITRRQLTRQEIEHADFKSYIASSSSEGESGDSTGGKEGASRKDKNLSRQKLRDLLLSGNADSIPEGWNEGEGSDIDMKITFTPGLSGKMDEEEETTLEKYQRVAREKRKKRKEGRKGSIQTQESGRDDRSKVEGDDFFDFEKDSDGESDEKVERGIEKVDVMKTRKRTSPRQEISRKSLALVATPQNIDEEPRHFDMKTVLKAEKHERHKGKKNRKGSKDVEEDLQEDFLINVNDDRFNLLHEDHQFAIDPNNPHFKNTKGMKAFLKERHRRQRRTYGEVGVETRFQMNNGGDQGLKSLVKSVKRKSQEAQVNGKRRRV